MIILLIMLAFLPFTTFAQTEVSGEVSGEWTAEDSPYIVVDSTWIPEDEELMISPGVDVFFNEDQGLYVYGILDASGTEDDSVRIRVVDDVEHWRGIRFYGRNQTGWNYASIICPDTAFVLDPNCTLIMNNCFVDADRTIAGDTYFGIRSGNLTFSHSILKSRSHHTATGGHLTANNTLFDFGADEDDEPGFWTLGTTFRLTSCEIIGALHAEEGIVYADSCRFLQTPIGRRTGLGIGLGRMTESYIEGGASAGRIYSQTSATFRNNTLLGGLNISGSVDVSGCIVGGSLDIDNCVTVSVLNSIFNGSLFMSSSDSIIIDSCSFIGNDPNNHGISYLGIEDNPHLSITRSVIRLNRISIDSRVNTILDHNTFVFDSSGFSAITSIGRDSIPTNNIFITLTPGQRLFSTQLVQGMEYNCVYGFEYISGPFEDPIPIDEIDSTNIIANPLIGWDDITPYISFNSPCIDRGDPEFELDADSTRSDIGARAYDYIHYISRPSDEVNYPKLLSLNAFPNPFNNTCRLRYELPFTASISIGLYDGLGRFIKEISDGNQSAGYHDCLIEASDLPAGVYFVRFSTDQFQQNRKILLIR
ncbi:T9SS type A sorting domain-containing protein [bacterium]|nr:T9SS type A sorting domain-containing protein [bacterium]